MRITTQQMELAWDAHCINAQARKNETSAASVIRHDVREYQREPDWERAEIDRRTQAYAAGQEILEKYRIVETRRSFLERQHAVLDGIDRYPDAVGYIPIFQRWVASQQLYHCAVFLPREESESP